ncbi:MAG: BREX system ATP-binding domain-containing protein [Candidatus Saliniplasma sp.]
MVICTVIEKILLHLKNYSNSVNTFEASFNITQAGIAERLGISEGHTSREILRLKKEYNGLIKEHLRKVKGIRKKRKVYSLTPKGYKKAEEILERIKDENIKIREENELREITLGDVGEYLDDPYPILKALKHLDDHKILDLTQRKKKEYIFVGREDYIERLKEILDSVKKDGCRSVFISGEAGIGKTSLVSRLKPYASENGFELLVGKSYYDSSDPYLPFKEAFEGYSESTQESSFFGDVLFRAQSQEDDQQSMSKKAFDAKRKSVFYESTEWVKDIASDKPLILFLDDLQWADKATLRLMHYMITKLDDKPVLFLGSYRPEEVEPGHPLKDVMQRLSRSHLYKELKLDPLTLQDTKEMLQKMVGGKEAPDEFLNVLHDVTKGNPLFIKECVGDMLERGVIEPEYHEYPKSADDMEIPTILMDVIERRIQKLDDTTIRVLQISSVLGEEVPFTILNKILEMDEFDLFEHIDKLVRTDIWFEKPNEEVFCFSHGLIHLTVYEGILNNIRKRYHLKAAEILEEEYEEHLEEHCTELAFHYEKADRVEEAIKYYSQAGKEAEKVYAHEDAIEMYEKVIQISDRISDEVVDRFDILFKIASAYHMIGEDDEFRKYQTKALDEAKTLEEKSKTYHRFATSLIKQGEYDKALKNAEEGLSLHEEESFQSIKLLDCKGWIFYRKGEIDKAEEIFREEEKIAERLGDKEALAWALNSLGTILIRKSEYEKSIEYLTRAMSLHKEFDDKRRLSYIYNGLGWAYVNNCELDKALEFHNKFLKISKDIGDINAIMTALNNIGSAYIKMGEIDKALTYYNKALERSKIIEEKYHRSVIIGNIGDHYLKKGDLEKALKYFGQSLRISEEIDNAYMIIENYLSYSELYLKKGKLTDAKSYIKKSMEKSKDIGYASKIGAGHRMMGTLFTRKEEWKKAEDAFEKSLKIFKDTGEKNELGRVYYEIGLMWAKRKNTEKAEKNLQEARSLYEKAGMEFWKEKVVEALKNLEKE